MSKIFSFTVYMSLLCCVVDYFVERFRGGMVFSVSCFSVSRLLGCDVTFRNWFSFGFRGGLDRL